jgi:hypothetical protein
MTGIQAAGSAPIAQAIKANSDKIVFQSNTQKPSPQPSASAHQSAGKKQSTPSANQAEQQKPLQTTKFSMHKKRWQESKAYLWNPQAPHHRRPKETNQKRHNPQRRTVVCITTGHGLKRPRHRH